MVGLVLLVLALLLFLLAGFNQTVLDQGPPDLVAFGLAAWVASLLLAASGRDFPLKRE